MRILNWEALNKRERAAALSRPTPAARAQVDIQVEGIRCHVRASGDTALRKFTAEFDRAFPEQLAVSPFEYESAQSALGTEQQQALARAIANVQRFHEAQIAPSVRLETEPGIRCEQIVRPIAKVGLYVPSGSAPLPSALIMMGVPARIAGCSQRIVCTPPRLDGSVHPAILFAAQLCGIDSIFKAGGAQAIAALAYGTESIPRVDKIFGPGNSHVTAAKQQVAQDPDGVPCDLPAGPSEVLVIADSQARPAIIASDLLAQLEHDPLSQAILVSDSTMLARAVQSELTLQAAQLSRRQVLAQSLSACRCLLVSDLEQAFEVANAYAPEHLILQVLEPRMWLSHVMNAGSVFLGPWTPEALGDYCSGTNHVLPTYGYARSVSGLTLRDFQKSISVQEATPQGLSALGPTAVTLAELEGLDGHARSVTRRLAILPKRSSPQPHTSDASRAAP